jgi:glycosyltransferase involved in cell wall biosynthesis
MNILLLQQFLTGPESPGPLTTRKLLRALADRGHSVEAVATDFNVYNEQSEPEESYNSPEGGSYRIHRVRSARGLRRGLAARLRTYLGFSLAAYPVAKALTKPDIVIGSIQPLFTGALALRLSNRWRVPFILEVRDLWPDALEAKRAITGWQARPLHWLANRLYERSSRIVSLTPGIKRVLTAKGIEPSKIDVFPNGFDPLMFEDGARKRIETRERLNWGDRFMAVYAGTHVEVTALETIIEAANCLRDNPNIRFAFFGRGQRKPALLKMAADLGLTNVEFHEPVPKHQIPSILYAADVCLMSLFRSPLIDIYFENKLIDYMAAGKPILAAMDGYQAELINKYQAGKTVASFDAAGLACLIANAARNPESMTEMGLNGRALVESKLLLPDIHNRYVEHIEAVAQGQSCRLQSWEPL